MGYGQKPNRGPTGREGDRQTTCWKGARFTVKAFESKAFFENLGLWTGEGRSELASPHAREHMAQVTCSPLRISPFIAQHRSDLVKLV